MVRECVFNVELEVVDKTVHMKTHERLCCHGDNVIHSHDQAASPHHWIILFNSLLLSPACDCKSGWVVPVAEMQPLYRV